MTSGTAGSSLVTGTATAILASFAICSRAKQALPLDCYKAATIRVSLPTTIVKVENLGKGKVVVLLTSVHSGWLRT